MRSYKSIGFALFFFVPLHTMAWGLLGHRVTGEIAEKYLTTTAKKEIQKLLGNESLAMASNWADFIKSDSTYNYIGPWHYIDLSTGMNAAQLRNYLKTDTVPDVYTKVNLIISQLRIKSLSKTKKIFYLKLLIHFIGDMHQPMHASHAEDNGGNNIRLTWFSTPTNLHRVWDENLIEFQQLSYTEMAAAVNYATAAQVKQWQKQPISDWVIESYDLAEQLYKEVQPNDKLSYPYNYSHLAMLNRQLLKGGVRLAGLLNQIFG